LSLRFSDKPFRKYFSLTLYTAVELSPYDAPWTVSMVTETCDWKHRFKLIDNRKILVHLLGSGSSVGIATDYGLDGPGSNPGGDEIFRPSRPAMGPTQPLVQWVPGLSWGQSAAGACC